MIQQALQNVELRIDSLVAKKVGEAMGTEIIGDPTKGYTRREQKLIDLVDNQGKDIAMDIAQMETQLHEMDLKIARVQVTPFVSSQMDTSVEQAKARIDEYLEQKL